jgi:hypothetical protein
MQIHARNISNENTDASDLVRRLDLISFVIYVLDEPFVKISLMFNLNFM